MDFRNMSNCTYMPLPQVLSFIVDNRGKTAPTSEEGIPLIATNCIKNNELYPVFEKIRYVSEDTYDNWFRAHPQPGDIIFVNKGTPGRVCMVPNPVGFCIAQDMMAFRVNDKIINNKYLFAVLRSHQFQSQIETFHVGTMIPHFKKGDLDKLMIPIPSMLIQKFIGETYFDLCNLIENNNRTNQVLEEIAQAIFKRWFVDFEFPTEDGEPYKSSGGEMVDSELGEIPKGWRVGELKELGEIVGGSTPSKTHPEYYSEQDIAWITPKDLSNDKSKFISRGGIDITPQGFRNSSAKKMPRGTVLFSSRAPIGYMAIAKNEITTNQGFKSVVPYKNIGTEYVYCFLIDNLNLIENRASGSTFKEVSGSVMKQIPVLIPQDKILNLFKIQCSELFNKQELLEAENKILTNIRDTLLPKLMSGEIRVPIEEVV